MPDFFWCPFTADILTFVNFLLFIFFLKINFQAKLTFTQQNVLKQKPQNTDNK